MTTNAATWFYSQPEPRKYYITERVNQTFWQARVNSIWLNCTRANPPFQMSGVWRDTAIEVEWLPNDHFILRSPADFDASDLVDGISRVIALEPSFDYTDEQERLVTEWHMEGGKDRWQEIQGKPSFGNPQRL